MNVKVEKVHIGKYDVDSIEICENGVAKEICFMKSDHVEDYLGKIVEIKEINGTIKISPFDKSNNADEKAMPKK